MNLFGYELKKVLIKQYALFIFLAVIMLKLFSLPGELDVNYGFGTSAEKSAYLEMIEPLAGKLTDEKEQIITDMKKRLLEADSLQSQLSNAYRAEDNEKINELDKQLEEFRDVLKNDDVIERIFEQYVYVSEDRETREIIPVKKVGIMEKASANYPFLLCICFCCAFAVMAEQTSKTHLIIRTTPNGQGKTMAAKIGVLFLTIGISSAVLSIIDFVTMSFQLPQNYWNCNIRSLERFANCPIKISIINVFVLVQLMRLLGALLIGAAAMLTAHFSRNYAASIFPYVALPIISDYVAERDSQSYFLPTGLLKGWGYFYGDVGEMGYSEYIIFHEVPLMYTCFLTAFSLIFVVAVSVILIHAGKNRLAKRRGGITKALGMTLSLLLLTSCSAEKTGVLSQYGGSISVYGDNSENSRYKFEIEYIQTDDSGHFTNTLNITDKQTGTTEQYAFSPFEERISLGSLFAAEDCLLFTMNFDIMRLDLDDFSLSTVYENSGMEKVVFGLMFDFGDEDIRFRPGGAFTDGRATYVYDTISGVARLGLDGKPQLLFTDNTSFGLEYDGKAFYYISQDEKLHKFDLSSGKNTIVFDGAADRFTLDGDSEFLYFQSYGAEIKLEKSSLTNVEQK